MKTKIITIFFLCFFGLCHAQNVVYLYTPNGSKVSAFLLEELYPYEIEYYNQEYSILYPHAELLADASLTYNCHSYAWNMVEGGATCWLNQRPDLHLYWDDGSYMQTTEDSVMKIFYYDGDHSAIKSITHPGKYESKWGAMPLFRHSPEYGPASYNMQYRNYYYGCYTRYVNNQTYNSGTHTILGCMIEISNTTIHPNTTVNIHAYDFVALKQNFHAQSGSNVVISTANYELKQSQSSMLFTNNEPKVEEPYLQSLLINNTNLTNQGPSLKLYPNPNKGTFNIDANFPLTDIANFKIVNLLGVPIYETQNVASNIVRLQNSASGQFFVIMILKDGTVLTQKMIIQK